MSFPQFQVALSFLERFDRAVAETIRARLAPALNGSVFVYWEHQDWLAGQGQTEGFGAVFAACRLAVVLLRPGWGSKGGTLIEAQRLHKRHLAGEKGFLYFLATSPEATIPEWASPDAIYYDLEKYGLGDAITGILRMTSASPPPPPSPLARIRARQSQEQEALERRWFLNSDSGRALIRTEATSLMERLVSSVRDFNEANPDLAMTIRLNRLKDQFLLSLRGQTAVISWQDPFRYGHDEPPIIYTEYDGLVQLRADEARPSRLGSMTGMAALTPLLRSQALEGWALTGLKNWPSAQRPQHLTSDAFLEFVVERVLERQVP